MAGPSINTPTTIKFLCSFGGKILPRYPNGKLRYHGSQTRVLAVDRSISFSGKTNFNFKIEVLLPKTTKKNSCNGKKQTSRSTIGLHWKEERMQYGFDLKNRATGRTATGIRPSGRTWVVGKAVDQIEKRCCFAREDSVCYM